MDDQAYLDPNFDPTTLTMPRLRSILVAHDVNYPASAKKGELVELFNQNIAPRARKMKSDSLRVKRSSRGIVDMPASQQSDVEEEEPGPGRSARSSRRTTRARTEEAQEVEPTPRSMRHSTAPPESMPRRASSKHLRAESEVEVEQPEPKRPVSRKTRLSAQTPVVKTEARDDESPFSMENVFQSGSSPPPPTDRRRTTTNLAKDIDRRRSREVRRRTEEVKPTREQIDGAVVPRREKFQVQMTVPKTEEVDADEEFAPEEEMALTQAEQAGELVRVRAKSKRVVSEAAQTGVSAILIAVLTGLAGLWSQEKFRVGYCGDISNPSREIAGTEIPEWADVVRPQCVPCPPHAYCDYNMETSCESGFVLTQHPLSLNGLLPFPPTCEPDSERARKVEQVKERAVEELRVRNADYECGKARSPEIKETELKVSISSKRTKRMNDREFEALWDSAIGEVHKAEEVSVGTDGSGDFTLRSNSLARFPLSCALRRSLRETLRAYLWQLVGILLVLSSGAYGRYTITSGRETEVKAKQLASLALEKLSYQAALHATEPEFYAEGYIPMAQLRDDVLRSEFSSTRRKKLWERVQKKVEGNSNVRPMTRTNRAGDVGRVWEWVGAVQLLENGSSSPMTGEGRRKSGRVSFGGKRWLEPGEGDGDSREMSQVSRRWEEGGRQYY